MKQSRMTSKCRQKGTDIDNNEKQCTKYSFFHIWERKKETVRKLHKLIKGWTDEKIEKKKQNPPSPHLPGPGSIKPMLVRQNTGFDFGKQLITNDVDEIK